MFAQADTLSHVQQKQHAPSTPPQTAAKSANGIQQQLAAGLPALADYIETRPQLISKAAALMPMLTEMLVPMFLSVLTGRHTLWRQSEAARTFNTTPSRS